MLNVIDKISHLILIITYANVLILIWGSSYIVTKKVINLKENYIKYSNLKHLQFENPTLISFANTSLIKT